MRNTAKTSGKQNSKSSPKRKPSILELANHQETRALMAQLKAIHSEATYEQAKANLRHLMLSTPDAPDNPYNGLIEFLAFQIEQYEETHYPLSKASSIEILKSLMDEHELTQKDLPEIGSQGVVSEILNGKRELNKRQISLLSQRFHVSPALFFDSL